MHTKSNTGFTIVELLVVITIIGLLMALLLPAINVARATAKQAQCLNQVRQIGVGTINFTSKKEYFPGYLSEMRTDARSGETRLVSWFTQLLPYLERNDLYDAIQKGVDGPPGTFASDTYLDLAVCPSDLPDTTNQPYLSYAINMGVWDPDVRATLGDGSGWRDEKANGISHNLAGLIGRYEPLYGGNPNANKAAKNKIKRQITVRQVSPSYVSSNDGSTTTVMIAENVDAGFWFTTDALPVDQGQYGVVWTHPVDSQLRINENQGFGSETNVEPKFARPSSEHNGIVVVGFCDGHAEQLGEQIDRQVYARLLTPNGKESDIDPSPFGPPNTPDYQKVPITDLDIKN